MATLGIGVDIVALSRIEAALARREGFLERIYTQEAAEFGLSPDHIIADFTGGTKPMSAGLVLACRDRWPMQYVTGGRRDRTDIASVPIYVRFTTAR